nr:MAG TPA: hypothetical protein [Caudoviricetes sp.]
MVIKKFISIFAERKQPTRRDTGQKKNRVLT